MKVVVLLSAVFLSSVLAVTPAAVGTVEATPQELQENQQQVEDQVAPCVHEGGEAEMLSAEDMASSAQVRFFTCPSDWVRYKNGCYLYVSPGRSWSSAVSYCASLGATLASVQDVFDYSFLQSLTSSSGGSVSWMGGFYFQGWRWLDQRPFSYSFWSSQNSVTSYPCIYLNARGGWSNANCNTVWPFTCMKRTDTC